MIKFVGWAFFLLLVLSSTLHSLDVTVGRSFKILGVTQQGGKWILPLSRGKYADLRVLSEDTYRSFQACAEPCALAQEPLTPQVAQVRADLSPRGIWIVEVDFLPSWRMTLLVVKKGENLEVRFPAYVEFLDVSLRARTQEMVLQAVQQAAAKEGI